MGYSNSARFPKKSPALLRRDYAVLAPVSRSCPPQLAHSHALLTRPPLAARVQAPRVAARLACVKRAASVQSEPGSNSSINLRVVPASFYLSCDAITRARKIYTRRRVIVSSPAPAHIGCILIIKEHSGRQETSIQELYYTLLAKKCTNREISLSVFFCFSHHHDRIKNMDTIIQAQKEVIGKYSFKNWFDCYTWLSGYIGDVKSEVWFLGENPSLYQLEKQSDKVSPVKTYNGTPAREIFY